MSQFAMGEPAQEIYNQRATHFRLKIFIRPEAEVEGRFMIELAERFQSDLLFPNVRVTSLHTKRPGMGQKLNSGEYSPRRWTAALNKLRDNQYAVLWLTAQLPDNPKQNISLSIHVNPPGGDEHIGSQQVEVHCSVSYLRHLAASSEKVEALLDLGKRAWTGVGRAAYGYGNLAISPKTLPWDTVKAPEVPAHAIPVAHAGEIDLNLESLYVKGAGIKGAFWANFLTAGHVALAGGESALRSRLPDVRIDSFADGGLLIVATDSPLPADTEENRTRFLRLEAALRPAFLSREQTPESKWKLLGYFFRERVP